MEHAIIVPHPVRYRRHQLDQQFIPNWLARRRLRWHPRDNVGSTPQYVYNTQQCSNITTTMRTDDDELLRHCHPRRVPLDILGHENTSKP